MFHLGKRIDDERSTALGIGNGINKPSTELKRVHGVHWH
jgi:hypothetical protein